MNILLVFIGGGIGSVLRYLVNNFIRSNAGSDFPYGIFAVNIIGSFLIGLLMGFLFSNMMNPEPGYSPDKVVAFMAVGVLGGFTTFSAFSFDAVSMINDGRWVAAITFIISSVVLSVAAAALGLWAMK